MLNNALGDTYSDFKWEGKVPDRMASFDGSIEKLLWPEKRDGDRKYMTRSGKLVPGVIDLTTSQSYLKVEAGFLPDRLQSLLGLGQRLFPWLFGERWYRNWANS